VSLLDGVISRSSTMTAAAAAALTTSASPVDDLDDLRRQLDVTRLVVQKVVIPSVVLFGVGGNLVNVAVLTRTDSPGGSTHHAACRDVPC